MTFLRRILARLTGTFAPPTPDAEIREEMAAHVEMETAENMRRGMTPDEARRQALIAAGGVDQAVESVRDQRGLPWLENIGADIRYAARTLFHNPGFAVVVAITLALGIGANTAIFSVIRGVLLRPLPNRDGEKLVYLRQSTNQPNGQNVNFSPTELRDMRAGVPALGGGIAEYSPYNVVLQGSGDATRLTAGLVTGNYFEVMGLAPALGRLTHASDDGPGVPPVVVLTYDFWRKRFGGDSGIVGKQVITDGQSATVIGVLEPAPFFPLQMDILMNMVISPHHTGAAMQNVRTHRMTEAVARLAPTATLKQANDQMAIVYARLKRDYPDAYDPKSGYNVAIIPFKRAMGERAQTTLWLLMSTAAFVLIIAAANVANLTLMRSVRREHELVVRAALGAGVARLRRLMLVENLMISVVGAVLGIAIAVGGVPLLVSLASRYSPRANEIHLDTTVLGFALLLAVVSALLFSMVAFLPGENALASATSGGRRASSSLKKQRLQRGLVVVQVAASVMLLAGAGLLTRTTMRLSDVPTGLKTENAITMRANLFAANRNDPKAVGLAYQQYARIKDEIAALPGVRRVGLGSTMPLRPVGIRIQFTVDGRPPLDPSAPALSGQVRMADADFFDAAGLPLLRGRPFASTDDLADGPKVLILNKLLADRLFPGEDPVGQRLALSTQFGMFTADLRTIVGVAANTQDGGPEGTPLPVIYVPFTQGPAFNGGFVIRADTNATGVATQAARIIRKAAPTVPVEDIMTVAQIKDEGVAPRRLNAALVSSFGLLAVLIAGVGIAGVLAFSVSARTNEIGIRMSLGAQTGMVERMILAEGGRLVAIGVVMGVVGAYASADLMRSLLFGITPHDPVTFAVVVVTMVAVGLAACWLPASRAARIDPAITLRAS